MFAFVGNNYKEIGHSRRHRYHLIEVLKRGCDPGYIFYRLKWHLAPRFKKVLRFPTHIDIEASDTCNLKCIMCVHGQPGGMPNTGVMDVNLAKRVIDQSAEYGAYSIKFSGRGEVLLHPKLAELVKYAKDKGIRETQVNTNGMCLNKRRVEELIHAGLDRIIFSLDGVKKETVESIRIGARYERIVENIKCFYTIKKREGLAKPFLRVQMVRTKTNYNEVEDFFKFWHPYVDDIRISDVTNRGQGDNLAVGDQISIGRKCCPMPWQRLFVARDGRVSSCCSDWFQEWVIGDATKENLIDIWTSPKMEIMRNINQEEKLSIFKPCSHCFSKDSYIWKKR